MIICFIRGGSAAGLRVTRMLKTGCMLMYLILLPLSGQPSLQGKPRMACRLASSKLLQARKRLKLIAEEKDHMKQLNHSRTMWWEGFRRTLMKAKQLSGAFLPAQTGTLMQISMIICIDQPTRGELILPSISRIKNGCSTLTLHSARLKGQRKLWR